MALMHDVALCGRTVRTTPEHDASPVLGQPRDPQGTFASLLRTYRERSGYSQARLAYLTGLNHGHISKLEASKRNASLETIGILTTVLNLSETEMVRLSLAAGRWPYHGELSDEAIDQIMKAVSE